LGRRYYYSVYSLQKSNWQDIPLSDPEAERVEDGPNDISFI
jgi:hypothetical protein